MIFYSEWFDNGLLFIQNLRTEDGQWLSYRNFCIEFNLAYRYMPVNDWLKALTRTNQIYKDLLTNEQHQINTPVLHNAPMTLAFW